MSPWALFQWGVPELPYTGKGLGYDMKGNITEISIWFGERIPRFELVIPVRGEPYLRRWP